MTQYKYLMKPGKIGNMELNNRIIFNPCDPFFGTTDGQVTREYINFYQRRAQGGAELVVVGQTHACTKIDLNDPWGTSPRIDDNAYIPAFFELTEAIHRTGAKVGVIVTLGAGAQSTGFPWDRGWEGIKEITNVGLSEKMMVPGRRVRQISIEEIETLIRVFGLAARRVKAAGFDVLYVHAWGGHFINQFISPRFNTRKDKYGGDFERRLRFLLELIEASRKCTGPDFPIVVKLSVDEMMPDGNHIEDTVKIAKRLEDVGVNAIDAGGGVRESMYMVVPPAYMPKGFMVYLAEALKKEVKIPVITGARIYEPDLAEQVLREGKADFVSVTRGMIADPLWMNKVKAGQADEIRQCVGCNHCIGSIFNNQTIRCTVNPTTGREWEFGEVPPKAIESKKVVIVGAGPGGMEAARIAGLRGHRVKLFEKTGQLGGGQLQIAACAPCRGEYRNIAAYQQSQFKKLRNVKVVLNKEVTAEDVLAEKPDAVILATGASPLIPQGIEGIKNRNVVTAWDVLSGKAKVSGKVVVAGGNLTGVETADALSENEMDVTIIEQRPVATVCDEEEPITRGILLSRLAKKGVKAMVGQKVEKITREGVVIVDKDNKRKTIPADYVVLALGARPYNPLEKELSGHVARCFVIGDARRPRKIIDAVYEGFLAGYEI